MSNAVIARIRTDRPSMLRARLRPERLVEPPIEKVGEICGVARA